MANVDAHMPDRLFVAGRTPAETVVGEISGRLNAAMDLLADVNMLDNDRVKILMACEQAGPGSPFDGNPEALARKLVRMNGVLREMRDA